jgi:hypothetical protein
MEQTIMRNTSELDNPFYSPFSGQVLIKAEEQGGKWVVYLEASNEGLDQEQEVILQKALENAKDYYLGHGVLSWDHKHKQTGLPKFIIGEPDDVQFNDDGKTLVKGWLYQKNDVSKDVWNNIQSGAQILGASVGGGILKKSNPTNAPMVKGVIQGVLWDEVALTHKPVNDATLGNVQLIPFKEFAKALMAGSGVNAANYSGGRALTGENLEETVTDLTFGQTDANQVVSYEEGRRFFDGLMASMTKGKVTSMNDVISYTLDQGYQDGVAASLIDFVARKIPKLRR